MALGVVGGGCATIGAPQEEILSTDPLDLGSDVTTVTIAPLPVDPAEVSDDAFSHFAAAFERELLTTVRGFLVRSSRYRLVSPCPSSCPEADATLRVGYEARRLGGFGRKNIGAGTDLLMAPYVGRSATVSVVQTGDLDGVDVQVVVEAVDRDGTVFARRVYTGTKVATVSGRQFSRSLADLTRDALDDATRKLGPDLSVAAGPSAP